jgi:hypothetical protein
VRLAGVYAMGELADDWQAGQQACIDVLCAYLRMPYTPPAESSDEQPPSQPRTNGVGLRKPNPHAGKPLNHVADRTSTIATYRAGHEVPP